MKRTMCMLLAIFFIFPLLSGAQNEGVKPVANPSKSQNPPKYARSTGEMSQIQKQGSTGGAGCPVGLSNADITCYLEPGWTSGRVMLKDNSILENQTLRYDLYHQQLQFVRDKDTLAFAKPEEVKCFMLGNHHFIYTDFQTGDVIGKGYMELVTEGHCKLLIRRTVKYHVSPESKPALDEDIYVRACTYYIAMNNEIARQIRVNKTSVLNAFKDKEAQVKQFMADHEMKMNSCEQLKAVVEYYNTLQ